MQIGCRLCRWRYCRDDVHIVSTSRQSGRQDVGKRMEAFGKPTTGTKTCVRRSNDRFGFNAGYKPATECRRVANPPERERLTECTREAPTLLPTLTPTLLPTLTPTLRRVCNPPPSVAGSATRGREKIAQNPYPNQRNLTHFALQNTERPGGESLRRAALVA